MGPLSLLEAAQRDGVELVVVGAYVSDIARRKLVKNQYVRSELMHADLITKAMDVSKLATLRGLIQLA